MGISEQILMRSMHAETSRHLKCGDQLSMHAETLELHDSCPLGNPAVCRLFYTTCMDDVMHAVVQEHTMSCRSQFSH